MYGVHEGSVVEFFHSCAGLLYVDPNPAALDMSDIFARLGVTDAQIGLIDNFRKNLSDETLTCELEKGCVSLDDLTCIRWLRANKWNVEKAADALLKHSKFRAEIAPAGFITEVRTQ